MPTKPNRAGQQQNYVPAGHGDASGEYGDNATGSNKHFKAFYKSKVEGEIKGNQSKSELKFSDAQNEIKKGIKNYAIGQEKYDILVKKLYSMNEDGTLNDNEYYELYDELQKYKIYKNKYEELKKAIDNAENVEKLDLISDIMNDEFVYQGTLIPEQMTMLSAEIGKKKEELNSKKLPEVKEEPKIEEEPKEESFEKVEPLKKTWQKQVEKFSDEDCYDFLINGFEGEFDVDKLKNASKEELQNLVIAKKNSLLKNKGIDSKYKKQLKELNEKDKAILWVNIPKDADALEKSLKDKKEFIDEKKEYWLQQDQNSEYVKEKLTLLDNLSNKIDNSQEILQNWQKENVENQKYYETIEKSNEILAKYENPNNVYSQKAKDNAHWFKTYESAKSYFGDMQKIYDKIGEKDLNCIKSYTSSYSYINEPLRKIKYAGIQSNKEKFIDTVKGMTNAINKSQLKENMWFSRGVGQLNVNGTTLNYYSNADDLNQLVGKTFEDQGFVSVSSHKGAGFGEGKGVMMNIYAPKGTKALYVDPISSFKGASEDETIIQRGYSYKITKAYKENGKIYLDCEVVLGSDSKKYDDNELLDLKNKYFD